MLINDASITGSLTVNASASFQHIIVSGNIIPDTNSTRNLGSTDRYFKEIYVSTGSINFVDNGNVVAVLNAGTITAIQTTTASANTRLDALESFTSSLNNTYTTDAELNASSSTLQSNINTKLNSSSFNSFSSSTNTFTSSATTRLNALESTSASVDTLNTTQNTRLGSLETISASNIARIGALETKSASVDTLNTTQNARLSALETTSASVDTLNTTQNTRLTNLEIKTGSLATTGSNTFIGTQTITGSLFISANLVVQGTSSLENITASAVSIGTNIINLNTANPAIRYAGLVIGDSGSIGSSGSFLYDSVQDEMIFVHRGANTTVTSSVTLMGPQTYDNIGNETYPTANRIQKGTGNEHLADSCIFDNGTTICFNATGSFLGRLDVGGNLNVGNTSTSSSITLTGSPVGGFTAGYIHYAKGNQTTSGLHIESPGTNLEITTGFNERITLSTGTGLQVYTNNGGGIYTSRMLLDRSGNACFSGNVCAPIARVSSYLQANDGTKDFYFNPGADFGLGALPTIQVVSNHSLQFATCNTLRATITNTGIACFSCQICTAGLQSSDSLIIRKDASVDNRYIQLCNTQTGGYRWDLVTRSTAQGCGFGILNHTTSQYALLFDANNIGSLACSLTINSATDDGQSALTVRARTSNSIVSRITSTSNNNLFNFISNGTQGHAILDMGRCTESGTFAGGFLRLRTDGNSWIQGGCLGVGTANPNATLHVGGTTGDVALFICSTCKTSNPSFLRLIGINSNDATTQMQIVHRGNHSNGGYTDRIDFSVNNGTLWCERVIRLDFNGNVAMCEGSLSVANSIARRGHDFHTGTQWYKIPFYIQKGTGSGTARTACLIVIDNNDNFQELHFTIEYASRLQGVSDSVTQTSLRTYGVNRFVGNTASVTDSNLITGGSGCAINTHAPMSVAIVGNCMSVVKVDFSSSLGSSSFVWGEVRIWSVESLGGKLTIANNDY